MCVVLLTHLILLYLITIITPAERQARKYSCQRANEGKKYVNIKNNCREKEMVITAKTLEAQFKLIYIFLPFRKFLERMVETCSASNHWTSSANSPGTSATCASAVFFTGLITALLESERSLGDPEQYPVDASSHLLNEYDFIVVGGGTAGSVVAARLSEIQQWNVLLIEAGGDPPLTSDIPAIFFSLQKTDIDWKFKTEPQEGSCQGIRDRQCNWARGKVLGGSSTINGMIYIRGMKGDFDDWAAAGNEGWNYDEVLEYFKKSEDFKPSANEENSEPFYHGEGGPVSVQRFESLDLAWTLMDAAKEAGYKQLGDINGPSQLGFAHLHGTITNGTRCNTAKAFLGPAKNRKNLHVIKHSKVSKIIIDPGTKVAKDVEFRSSDGKLYQVKIKKEVIVSAGAINSPQVLMLSGIGPEEHLKEFGINVIKDLKVGENLQDHLSFIGSLYNIRKSDKIQSTPLSFLDASYEYLTRRTGPLATLYGTTVTGFIKTKFSPNERPDIEILYFVILANDTNAAVTVGNGFGLTNETILSLQEISKEGDVLILVPVLSRPRSKGKILLRSSNPSDDPKIHAGYFTDGRDLDTMLESIEATTVIMQTDVLKSRDARRRRLAVNSCEGFDFDTRPYWECMLRSIATSAFHSVGTCKMGPGSDPESVVDPKLRVHGVKGIRVADASIMPTIVGTPTYATTIMIGEKAADMIKRDWLQ
jgi:choline dehydrogenase-like flavoprotein